MAQHARWKTVGVSVFVIVAAVALLVTTSSWLSLGGGLTFAEAGQQTTPAHENVPPVEVSAINALLTVALALLTVATRRWLSRVYSDPHE